MGPCWLEYCGLVLIGRKKIVSKFGWDDHLLGCFGQFNPAGYGEGQAGFLAVILSGVFGSHNIFILYIGRVIAKIKE